MSNLPTKIFIDIPNPRVTATKVSNRYKNELLSYPLCDGIIGARASTARVYVKCFVNEKINYLRKMNTATHQYKLIFNIMDEWLKRDMC